jgi:hypothetical protein
MYGVSVRNDIIWNETLLKTEELADREHYQIGSLMRALAFAVKHKPQHVNRKRFQQGRI